MQVELSFSSLILTVTLGALVACTEIPEDRLFDYWESLGGDDTGAEQGDAADGGSEGGAGEGGAGDDGSGDGDSDAGGDGGFDGGSGDGNDGSEDSGDGDGDGDADPQPGGGDEMCVPVSIAADVWDVPADIILIVDNSSSMTQEAAFVQVELNDFAAKLELDGVDHHIVLISAYPHNDDKGICVQPPLGSGNCPNDDDNPPRYRHVDETISNHNALAKLIASQNEWEDSIRPDSVKHIVVVSDDDSELGANAFAGQFHALGDDYDAFEFHAIVCPWDCPQAGNVGQTYIDLVYETGGVLGDLCQQDFQPVFEELADSVVQNTPMSCHFDIPAPPMDMNLDHDLINVEIGDGNNPEDIPRVDALSDCVNHPDGWYYDDPGSPAQIYLCPQTCQKAQDYEPGVINVKFGCETITSN